MIIFGLDGNGNAEKIAKNLDVPLSKVTQVDFEDGEVHVRSDVNVRGRDVYVVSSLHEDQKSSVSDKLVRALIFIGSLKDASAKRITLICQYLCFSRQDRKTESRAPITTKYIAQCLESVGLNRLLTIDVHNLSAFQNAFRIPTDNLEAKNIIADYLCGVDENGMDVENCINDPLIKNPKDIAVLSPDSGGMGRCRRFRNALEKRLNLKNQIGIVYLDKERTNTGKVTGSKIIGDIKNKRVIVLDDLISTGTTIKTCKETVDLFDGKIWAVCATHGLFVGNAEENLNGIKRLVITDTIPPFRLDQKNWKDRLHVIPTTRMFAQAIKRTHEEGGSISDLLR